MQCPSCGTQIPNTAKFCTHCGALMRAAEPKLAQSPNPPAAQTPGQQPAYGQNQQPVYGQNQRPVYGQNQQPAYGQNQQPVYSQSQQPVNGQYTRQSAAGQPAGVGARTAGQPGPASAPVRKTPETPGRPVGEPLQSTPEPESQPLIQAPKKAPFGLRLLSVVLAVLVVLSGLCTCLLAAFRMSFNPEAVREMAYDFDPSEIRMPGEGGESITLSRYISEQVGMNLEEEYGITDAELTRVLSQPFVKNFVGSVLADYTDYFLNDAPLEPLTRNRVVDFLRENDYEIQRITGYSFREYEDDFNYYSDRYNEEYDLDSMFESLGSRVLDTSFLQSKLGISLSLLKFLMSGLLLGLLIALTVILLLLIFLTLHRYMRSAMTRSGVSLIVLGGLALLIGSGGMLTFLLTKLGLIGAIVNPMLGKLMILGGVILAVGILLVLLRRLFRKPARKPAETKLA